VFNVERQLMAQDEKQIDVYLEVGKSRTFAVALDWPGWCRSGRDEAAALQALCDYGPRYGRALESTGIAFVAPADAAAFVVVERQAGNATTDFGAPSLALPGDTQPVAPAELEHWRAVLLACWKAFDEAVEAANGKQLSKGPRGGGRDLDKVVAHVREVDVAYLKSLGGTLKLDGEEDPAQALEHVRAAILAALDAAVRGEIPAHGPRGGARWTPRYFVRRLAWHELDHAWEIEDRAG